MNKNKLEQIIFYSTLIIFIIILTMTILSFYFLDSQNIPSYLFFFVEYHVLFMISIGILGIIFGSYTQIISNKKIEKNQEEIEEIKKLFQKSLNPYHLKILKYLKNNNGVSTQYELTKLNGLNKLKVSRILEELNKQNLIKKEKVGKINKIYLSKKLEKII